MAHASGYRARPLPLEESIGRDRARGRALDELDLLRHIRLLEYLILAVLASCLGIAALALVLS